MSSALKPALPPASGQTSPGNATSAGGKAVMSGAQGMTQHNASAASYPSGPLGHVPQNLTALPHAHGTIGMSATNSTNMAANISVNAVPNMGSHSAVNQGTPLNVPGPTKAAGGGGTGTGAAIPASSVPTTAGTTAAATVPHGRPTAHPYQSSSVTATPPSASATHPARDEEGTTLPASQNSAQLMAVHKAQQNQQPQHHHPQQSQQSPQQQQQSQPQQQQQQSQPQPHHNDQQSQNITDRFKQNQQQQQQTPQQQQQAAQSNGTMSGPADATCNKTTVPTPPATADAKTESSPQTAIPPVQNHVPTPSSTVTHEQNNTKQPVDATTPTSSSTSTAVPPPPPPPAPTPTSASSEPKPSPAAVITPPAAEPAAEPSQTVATTPTKAAVVPKETPKAPSTLKLATTPRTTNRKRETKMTKTSESPKGNATSSVKTSDGRSPGAQNNKPPDRTPKNARSVSEEDRKSKRTRTRTQPYQSPLPELALITKLSSAGSSSPSKAHDEKLIVFYKNEFLAVRNAEGGFYVCQAVQNVYKSSPRIRIRWLSQDKQDKIYIPDFYDFTDFDCILTNLNMERVEKGKYNLPKDELERTENILKRALAVESGGSAPSLTEEHPDGLDLSLFRDESQLKKKRKSAKRKSSEPLSASSGELNNSRTRKTPDKMKVRKVSKSPATKSTIKRNNQQAPSDRRTTVNATSAGGNNEKKDGAGRTSRRSDSGRAERAKRRNESTGSTASKTSPVVDPKKARVLAKVALKTAIPPAAVVAAAQNKKKVGRTAPAVKAPTGNASSVKVGTKTLTRSSQAPASSTAAATIVTTAASSAPSTRRGKKTKK